MGPQVVLLGVDMRSQRRKDRIIPQVGPAQAAGAGPVSKAGFFLYPAARWLVFGQPSSMRLQPMPCPGGPHSSTLAPIRLLPPLQATFDLLNRTVDALPAGPQHLVVLSGIPVVFPKVSLGGAAVGRVTARRYDEAKSRGRVGGLQLTPPQLTPTLSGCCCLLLLAGLSATHPALPCPRAQIPAAESILGCINKLTRRVDTFRNVARSTGRRTRWRRGLRCRGGAACAAVAARGMPLCPPVVGLAGTLGHSAPPCWQALPWLPPSSPGTPSRHD
jgi:hypothetical protein